MQYPRLVQRLLGEAIRDSPVVLIQGPRQSGKTTLVRTFLEPLGYTYYSFDTESTLNAASADPEGFVADLPDKVVLDEIQRVPALFRSLKHQIDQNRQPGRFVLSGSANILLLPQLSDSLAGRMEVLRLHPLTQTELQQTTGGFIEHLLSSDRLDTQHLSSERLGDALAQRIVAGGFPSALERTREPRIQRWYSDYVSSVIQRDISEIASIASIDSIPRLFSIIASNTSRLLNVAELASPLSISRPTIKHYVSLLEAIFLVDVLPPWHKNLAQRLVKTPRLFCTDTGIACAAIRQTTTSLRTIPELYGRMVETYVIQELKRMTSWMDEAVAISYYRDKDGFEVDAILETQGRLVGIEVKSSSTVTTSDFRGLRKLKSLAGSEFHRGIVLYDGAQALSFGDSMFAVPIGALSNSIPPSSR
jgi:predicted AAA+ superfamily ATPase